jgi:hypothetical protein
MVRGLSTAERTGSPVLHTLWSYVLETNSKQNICPNTLNTMYKALHQRE